jgi:multidrug transporter EmrE-like cation transporter
MMHWMSLSVTVVLTAVANLLLKYSAMHRRSDASGFAATIWEMATTPTIIAGVACLGVAMIAYTFALRKIDLGVGYPVMATSVVVIVTALSTILWGEPFTLVRAVGTVIVICGVVLLSA